MEKIFLSKGNAKEIFETLCKEYSHRFQRLSENEFIFVYKYWDSVGDIYNADIYLRIASNNKTIFVYVRKQSFIKEVLNCFDYIVDDIIILLRDFIREIGGEVE